MWNIKWGFIVAPMCIQEIMINNFVIVFHICKKNLCKEQTFLLVHSTVYTFQMVATVKI